MPIEKSTIAIVNEDDIREKVYTVRGIRVMLDFDLARIYGYTTKAFNQQVQRNIEKFDSDFMFRLTRDELNDLVRSQFVTSRTTSIFSGQEGGIRYLPYAFTEQGIYMLMTVLHGKLAVEQSKALIRLFKQMKDYIAGTKLWLTPAERRLIFGSLDKHDKEIARLEQGLDETQAMLSDFMAGFGENPFAREIVFLDGELVEADNVYHEIYSQAKVTIDVIDNYPSIKTLLHLRKASDGVAVTLYTANKGTGISETDLDDFKQEYPEVQLEVKRTDVIFHDRFIVLDRGLNSERIFVCGASSKDAGKRATAIYESTLPDLYHPLFDRLEDAKNLGL